MEVYDSYIASRLKRFGVSSWVGDINTILDTIGSISSTLKESGLDSLFRSNNVDAFGNISGIAKLCEMGVSDGQIANTKVYIDSLFGDDISDLAGISDVVMEQSSSLEDLESIDDYEDIEDDTILNDDYDLDDEGDDITDDSDNGTFSNEEGVLDEDYDLDDDTVSGLLSDLNDVEPLDEDYDLDSDGYDLDESIDISGNSGIDDVYGVSADEEDDYDLDVDDTSDITDAMSNDSNESESDFFEEGITDDYDLDSDEYEDSVDVDDTDYDLDADEEEYDLDSEGDNILSDDISDIALDSEDIDDFDLDAEDNSDDDTFSPSFDTTDEDDFDLDAEDDDDGSYSVDEILKSRGSDVLGRNNSDGVGHRPSGSFEGHSNNFADSDESFETLGISSVQSAISNKSSTDRLADNLVRVLEVPSLARSFGGKVKAALIVDDTTVVDNT